MYSISSKTLAIALVVLWAVLTPIWTVAQTMAASHQMYMEEVSQQGATTYLARPCLTLTLSLLEMPLSATRPHPSATCAVLWSQAEGPTSVELRVPEALVSTLLTEQRLSNPIDLCVPGALLTHLYGVGQVLELESSKR